MLLIALGLVLLALVGVPLFSLFGGAAIALFFSLPEGDWSSATIDVFSLHFAENPTLMTLPLFTFAGYLLAESGMPRRLVALSRAWLGFMPGGLAIVCLGASAFFTTFTGGSGITIVAVGGLLLPSMLKEGYPEKFTYGLVTTGGSLGILFPPAVPLVLYGIIANLTLSKLLVAGILPGMLVCVVLGVYSAYIGLRSGFTPTPFVWSRARATLWEAKWEIAIPVVLLGGLGTGVLRIHEASVFTAPYVLIIEVFVYRDISVRRDLLRVVTESMTLIGAILMIMACAIGFTGWMIQFQIPIKLLDFMEGLISSRFVFLIVLNVFLIIVGMVMEIFAAIVVAVPLILPLATAYGLDPYHFAIIFLLNLEIAYLMPPLGINLFISSIRFGKPVTELYGTVLVFIAVLFVTLMVVCYVPSITTFLPSLIDAEELQLAATKDPEGVTLEDSDFGMTDEELDALEAGDFGGLVGDESTDAGVDASRGEAGDEPGEEPAAKPAEPAEEASP